MSSTGSSRKRKPTALSRSGKVKKSRTVRRYQGTAVRVYVGRGPVAKETVVWLRYNQPNANTNVILDQRFNLNSIFDPDLSAGGHQPMGRDQYATFYNRYRVTHVKVKIVACMDAVISSAVGRLTILANNNSTAYTDVTEMTEQQGSFSTLLQAGGGAFTFKRVYDLAKITGVDANAYKDDRFQAVMSADPVEQIVLHVGTCGQDGTLLTTNNIRYFTTLEMRCELYDPITLAQS